VYATNAAPFNTTLASRKDIVTALRANDGSLLWHVETDGVVSTQDKRALVVVDGTVYITTNRLLNAGTQNATVVSSVSARRAVDGTLLWHYQAGGEIQPRAILGGVVYITAGELFALRANDGMVLWHRPYDPNVTDFIADHGMLYISTGPGNPGTVAALHANDGSLAWKARFGNASISQLSVMDGLLFVGGRTGDGATTTIYALRSQNGTLLWHSQSHVFAFTNVSSGTIYLFTVDASGSTISALRARDGAQLWQQPQRSATFFASLVVQGEILYGSNPEAGLGGSVSAYRTRDGTPLWNSQAQDREGARALVGLLTDNERAYISSSFSNNGFQGSFLEVHKASDGVVLWQYPYQRRSSLFELVEGVVYVGASSGFYQGDHHSGSVCALQARTGRQLWCHQATTGVAPLTIGS
jgi:outer membrane protein assembly factor BamB